MDARDPRDPTLMESRVEHRNYARWSGAGQGGPRGGPEFLNTLLALVVLVGYYMYIVCGAKEVQGVRRVVALRPSGRALGDSARPLVRRARKCCRCVRRVNAHGGARAYKRSATRKSDEPLS